MEHSESPSSDPTSVAPYAASTAAPGLGTSNSRGGRAGRIGKIALALGLCGFLIWAALAPLDEGVPSQGNVVLDTKRKTIQHQIGGIVKELAVTEGALVQEGQLVIRLDDAAAKANFESVRQRYFGLRATEARLLAEQGNRSSIAYGPELEAAAPDPLLRQQRHNQEMLFSARRASLSAELQSIDESILGQEASSKAYQDMLENRRRQLALFNEELVQTRGLVKEGYVPRNRQLELERQASEVTSSIAELLGNINRSTRLVGELRHRRVFRQQEYRKEVDTLLTEVGRDALAEAERYRALSDELARTEIRSPAAGQVVALAVHTVGGVIAPGQKLMDIVPANEALMLEVRVAPHLIDKVSAALPVDVRFSSFAHSPQLVVEGKVATVSGDLLTEPQTNVSYYLARVAITPEGLKKLGKRQMQAGMPVEVIFKTGQRSLLAYLLHPLSKRVAASMTEE